MPNEFFGRAQDLSRLVPRLGSAIFIDPFAVLLRVDGGATRKEEAIGLQDLDEVRRPLGINLPVAFRFPAAGAGAVNDRIECSARALHGVTISNVDRTDRVRLCRQL